MRRIVSIIATIAMLATMLTVPAFAATADVNSVILGPLNMSGTLTDYEGGMATSVSARKYTKAAGSADNKINVSYSEKELNAFAEFDSNDRIHASMWYLAPTQNPLTVAFMMADYGLDISDRYGLSSIPVNKWTKIDLFLQPQWTYVYNDGTSDNTVVLNRIIDIKGTKDAVGAGFWEALLGSDYDSSKTYTLGSVSVGEFDVYVNGTLAMSKKSRKLGSEGYYSSVATSRLAFYTDGAVDTEFYIHNGTIDVVNDFDVSTFDFGMASLVDGADYIAVDSNLILRGDVTAADILADGYSVNAYTYDAGTYTSIPSDTALSIGDTVVVQNQNSDNLEIMYYTVTDGILHKYSNGNLTVANSSTAAGTGIGGKSSDDTSGAAEAGKDSFYEATGADGSTPAFIYTFEGYKVITLNMYISDNTQGGTFRLTGQYGSIYSSDISVAKLVPNQWNKVDFVLKMNATYGEGYTGAEPDTLTSTLYNGTASTYVNGVAVATNIKHAFGGWIKAGGSDPIRHGYTLRPGFNGLPQGVAAYIDDYSSYYTYFEPELEGTPVISGDMVVNGAIYAESGTTLAEVMSGITTETGDTVKVFDIADGVYTEVTDDSVDAIGKTVVVTNPANRISYYSIKNTADSKSYIYNESFDGSPTIATGNATSMYTASLAGKGSDDAAIGLGLGYLTGAGGVVESDTSISGYVDKNGAPVTANNILVDEEGNKKPTTNSDRFISFDYVDGMSSFSEIKGLKGYKVVSANIMYTGTATEEKFRISTNNSGSVSGNISLSRLVPNQWNRVDFVIEMQGDKNPPAQKSDSEIIEIANGVCTTYVNGRKVAERNSCYGAYIWHYALANYSNCSGFRLGFEIKSGSDVVGYVDDYTSYFTPFAPDMSEFDTAPDAVKASIGDAVPAGEGVAVYADSSYTDVVTDTLALGNVIVKETVVDSANGIRRYGYCAISPVTVAETTAGINVTTTYTDGVLVIAEYNAEGIVNVLYHDISEGNSVDYSPEGTNAVKIMTFKDRLSLAPLGVYVRY